MPTRLRIEGRDQYAIDFDGNPLAVYIEDDPIPKPEGWVSVMVCPECTDGILIKGGTSGMDGSVPYRCNNTLCEVKWMRKMKMEPDIILEMGGFYT